MRLLNQPFVKFSNVAKLPEQISDAILPNSQLSMGLQGKVLTEAINGRNDLAPSQSNLRFDPVGCKDFVWSMP